MLRQILFYYIRRYFSSFFQNLLSYINKKTKRVMPAATKIKDVNHNKNFALPLLKLKARFNTRLIDVFLTSSRGSGISIFSASFAICFSISRLFIFSLLFHSNFKFIQSISVCPKHGAEWLVQYDCNFFVLES